MVLASYLMASPGFMVVGGAPMPSSGPSGVAGCPASGGPIQRRERSTLWFQLYRRGGRVILHHGHIRPVLVRDWSRPMDGIAATIWASQTTLPLRSDDRLNLAAS